MEFCREINVLRVRCSDALILGIIASLAIHAILISVLSIISASKTSYVTKTITISLEQRDSTPFGAQELVKHQEDRKLSRQNKSVSPEEIANGLTPKIAYDHPKIEESLKNPQSSQLVINDRHDTPLFSGGEMKNMGRGEQGNHSRQDGLDRIGKLLGPVETSFGSAGAPAFVHQEMPLYPILAKRLGKEGKVVLKLLIDENGKLLNIEVLENAGYGFLESSVAAIRKSTYAPAVRNGERVSAKAILPVRFHLQ